MPLSYGFSWLQEVILYSKITMVSDMEGSFENDAVIIYKRGLGWLSPDPFEGGSFSRLV